MSTIVRPQLSVITICRPLSHSLVTNLTCLIHTSLLSPTLRYSIRASLPKGEENEEIKERGNISVPLYTKENGGSGCRAPPTGARHPVMGHTVKENGLRFSQWPRTAHTSSVECMTCVPQPTGAGVLIGQSCADLVQVFPAAANSWVQWPCHV